MSAEGWPPRKDYVATYAKYSEMRTCAEAELLMLLEKRKCVSPTTPNETRDLLELDIAKARAYLSGLDRVMAKFSKALCMLGRTRGKSEYELFVRLIVRGNDPKTVAADMSLEVHYVYNVRSRLKKALAKCSH